MRIIFELKAYLKSLDTIKYRFNTHEEKVIAFLRVFLLYFSIVLFLSVITGVIRVVFNISFAPRSIDTPMFFIINVLLFPVLEETAFRLPLIYKRLNESLSVLIVSYYVTSVIFAGDVVNVDTQILLRIAFSIILATVVYFILLIKKVEQKVARFYDNYYKIVFYTLLLMFTLRHLDSYILSATVLLFSPLLLLPQLIGGIFFSFTRIRFGFVCAIILHMIINFIAFTPQLILLYAN
ncbi:MAG: CPBP family intramembrane metalloprotease [Bacteroidales bacterium]|nr:CPBP family intramembrane metalloprotease [Bacteroidales bacterium]